MQTIEKWYECVEIMIAKAKAEEIWYFIMIDWESDEIKSAEEVLETRLGYPIPIFLHHPLGHPRTLAHLFFA